MTQCLFTNCPRDAHGHMVCRFHWRRLSVDMRGLFLVAMRKARAR